MFEAWPYSVKASSCHIAKAQFKLASGWSPWITELIIFLGCNNQVKYSLPWLSYCLTSQPHLHPTTSSTLLLTLPSLYLFKIDSVTGRGYRVPTGGMEKPVWGEKKQHKSLACLSNCKQCCFLNSFRLAPFLNPQNLIVCVYICHCVHQTRAAYARDPAAPGQVFKIKKRFGCLL